MIRKIDGGVTAAKGFSAAAAAAQIKYRGRNDMALIYSEAPCAAAGTFTSNVVKAAPVLWDRQLVREGRGIRAVVVNSGIANACTGEEGMEACRRTAAAAASALDIPEDSVAVGSTGVIGMQLPVDRITAGVSLLAADMEDTREAGIRAAEAIMTTDTARKEAAYTFEAGGKTVTIGGMCKGSGMIHPNMCTMLAYITTDCAVSAELLQKSLSAAVTDSFNMISVDGDTSTNDTCLLMANGLAGNAEITEGTDDCAALFEAVAAVCTDLARQMAADGEGATKLIESCVVGADTKEHARILAKSVITSSLTKAAVFGCDANWGRILCALGYAGVDFDPDNVDVSFEDGGRSVLIYTNGSAADFDETEITAMLKKDRVRIVSDMHMGAETATAWGCDLTLDYVRINADYRS